MISEATFFEVFEKNCQEKILTEEMKEEVIERLYERKCPFPSVCRTAGKGQWTCGCLGVHGEPTLPCPVSEEWQNQVVFFCCYRYIGWVIDGMIKIVENLEVRKNDRDE